MLSEICNQSEQTAAGGEKIAAAEEVKSLGFILHDKISRTREKSLKDRLRSDSIDLVPTIDSSAGTNRIDGQSREIGSSDERRASSTASEKSEWVEEDDPGVYITFVISPNGRRGLKRVRFRCDSCHRYFRDS